LRQADKLLWVSKDEVLEILRSNPSDPDFLQDISDLEVGLEGLSDPWER